MLGRNCTSDVYVLDYNELTDSKFLWELCGMILEVTSMHWDVGKLVLLPPPQVTFIKKRQVSSVGMYLQSINSSLMRTAVFFMLFSVPVLTAFDRSMKELLQCSEIYVWPPITQVTLTGHVVLTKCIYSSMSNWLLSSTFCELFKAISCSHLLPLLYGNFNCITVKSKHS